MLQAKVLKYGLDHDVGSAQVRAPRGVAVADADDPRQGAIRVELRHAALLNTGGEVPLNLAFTAGDGCCVAILQDDADACRGADLR